VTTGPAANVTPFGTGAGFVTKVAPAIGAATPAPVPRQISFPYTAIGASSSAATAIYNYGDAPFVVSALASTGPFGATSDCASPIAPGDHCTVSIDFAPTAATGQTGALSIAYAGGLPDDVVLLSGRGTTCNLRASMYTDQLFAGSTHATTDFYVTASGAPGAVTAAIGFPTGVEVVSLQGMGWSCDVALTTCSRSDTSPPSGTYPPIHASLRVPAGDKISGAVVLQASAACDVTPADNAQMFQFDVPAADLGVTLGRAQPLIDAGRANSYGIGVYNGGHGVTTDTARVVIDLPEGASVGSLGGTGWTCDAPTASCSRADPLMPSATYPSILLGALIPADARGDVTLRARVTGTETGDPKDDVAADVGTAIDPGTIAFQVNLDAREISLERGHGMELPITVVPLAGFGGFVHLSCESDKPSVTCSFDFLSAETDVATNGRSTRVNMQVVRPQLGLGALFVLAGVCVIVARSRRPWHGLLLFSFCCVISCTPRTSALLATLIADEIGPATVTLHATDPMNVIPPQTLTLTVDLP
jgi:hypothetical protein